jgi:hypothetical protein
MGATKKNLAKKNPETIQLIMAEIATTKLSTKKICTNHGITQKTLMQWLVADVNLSEQYARAKEAQMDVIVEEMMELSANEKIDSNSRRVQLDTIKWLASKLKPKKYGEKVGVEHSGNIGVTVEVIDRFEVPK